MTSRIYSIIHEQHVMLDKIAVYPESKGLMVPVKVNMNQGLIEVLLCTPSGKTHESLFVTDVTPVQLQAAFLLLGYTPVNDFLDSKIPNQSNGDSLIKKQQEFRIFVTSDTCKNAMIIKVEDLLQNTLTKKNLQACTWNFFGLKKNEDGTYVKGNGISMFTTYFDRFALFNLTNDEKNDDEIISIVPNAPLKIKQTVFLIIMPFKKQS
jgi:hypothetical protein